MVAIDRRPAEGTAAKDPEGSRSGLGVEGVDWVEPEEPEPVFDDAFEAVVARRLVAKQEWEVVFGGAPVNVRGEMDVISEVMDTRVKGDIIFGRDDGGWVELLDGTGYVKIHLDPANSTTLVKQSDTTYAELVSGRCKDVGMYPVLEAFACQAVGFELGHPDKHVKTYPGKELVRPEGCYLLEETGQLWLATGPSNRGHGAGRLRRPICSSRRDYAGGT